MKRQSSEWRLPSSPRPQKAIRKQGLLKIMHVIFFDVQGIILDHPVPHGSTVNGDYYKMILKDKLFPAVKRKRPNLVESGVILLHDNASPHRRSDVIEQIDSLNWEILLHPCTPLISHLVMLSCSPGLRILCGDSDFKMKMKSFCS